MPNQSITFGIVNGTADDCLTEPSPRQFQDEFGSLANDDERTKHVYAVFGLAAYWCQCLEEGLCGVLLIHARLSGSARRLSDFEDLEEKAMRKTFGQLLSEIRQVVAFEGGADVLLADALKVRNHLIHSFFRSNAERFISRKGQQSMVDELCVHINCLINANTVLDTMTHCFLKFLGIDRDMLVAAYKQLACEEKDS